MSSPILRVTNPAGGLVLGSRASFGLNYIGQATPISLTQPTGNAALFTGRRAGSSVYRITSVNRPVPFYKLMMGHTIRVNSVDNVGGNTWDINVFCGNTGSVDSDGFETQAYTTIYCFAVPTGHSGVGLRINDDAGNLRWSVTDTSGRLLFLKGSFSLAGTAGELDGDFSIPSLAVPALLGTPSSRRQNSLPAGSLFDNRQLRFGFQQLSGTVVRQSNYFQRKWRDDGDVTNINSPAPLDVMVIDASGL
ncbi:hypothetical protein MW290_25475 [Aquincola tertiaricarbonis]|uniref:Uncharacterized protein n=1 Tax=Aquincola tertiaricarbonis TaxID=391953 RepID=A0ABY4SAJ0_AQUTE|nr:hypothetical protein [Aquincola tertiaricarbonis]URI08922.1 hypothetical protein MW290_25475 [Aquincola tertiaricarbonis]